MAAPHQDEVLADLLLFLDSSIPVSAGREVRVQSHIELEVELIYQGLDNSTLSRLVHGLHGDVEGSLQGDDGGLQAV